MSNDFNEQELQKLDKDILVKLFLSQQEQLKDLNAKMDLLIEQVALSKQQRFGRSSEKLEADEEQLSVFLNEAEALKANFVIPEPDMEDVAAHKRRKKVGKRDEDLKELPVTVVEHYLSDDVLREHFPNGYKQLPDEIFKRLVYEPPKWVVHEHHVGVYAGKDNQTIIKGNRPLDLLRNSILTPSLAAAIMNGKYVNALPLYRLEQEFKRQDITITRQVMANWMISLAERYLSLWYDKVRQELMTYPVIQMDETPVLVSKDGRKAGSKSYMWVARTGTMYDAPAMILYEYQKTRKTDHPREFLKGYSGTLVTDGYEVYHKLAREEQEIEVAGCWSHARRPFAELVKATGKDKAKGSLAYDALAQIGLIYKTDKTLRESGLKSDEFVKQRQLLVKPLVDAFFQWIRKHRSEVAPKSKTGKGFTYCLNQEPYLRVFLENDKLPLDNNATEQAIRPFCIGKKNWKLIDTVNGAKASAIIYSVAETAKANNLKPYEYFKYLLEEIPKHMDDKDNELVFMDSLLPWSKALPDHCRKQKD